MKLLLLTNLLGIAAIIGIIYWFWLYRPKQVSATTEKITTIIVDNGVYTPDRITTKQQQSITLQFLRKDPSPCAEWVIFPHSNQSFQLILDQPQTVTLQPLKAGDYEFTCQMGMYRGHLVVL